MARRLSSTVTVSAAVLLITLYFLFSFIDLSDVHSNVRTVHSSAVKVTSTVMGYGDQYYMISFPKSGRTWLRYMLGYAFTQHYNVEASEHERLIATDLQKLDRRMPSLKITHQKGQLEKTTNIDKWNIGSSRMLQKNILFLIRDPRDVIVSDFFEKSYRNHLCTFAIDSGLNDLKPRGEKYCWEYEVGKDPRFPRRTPEEEGRDGTQRTCSCFPKDFTLHQFIHMKIGGFQALVDYDRIWIETGTQKGRNFKMVRYEDLKEKPHQELGHLLSWFGISASAKVIADTVKAGSFEAMRELEVSRSAGGRLAPVDVDDINTYKTRKGEIGAFVHYFDQGDLDWMKQVMEEGLPKESGYV